MELIEKMQNNASVMNKIKNIAENITIWYVDYNDNLNDYSYEKLSELLFSEDDNISDLFDTYQDEIYQSEEIFSVLETEFPELWLSDLDETDKIEIVEFIRDIAIDYFKWTDFKSEIIKQSANRWINIEMPYYREVFSLMESTPWFYELPTREQYIKIISECAKRMWIVDTLEQYLYARNMYMKHSLFTRKQVEFALSNVQQWKLWVRNYYKKVLEFMLSDTNLYNTDKLSLWVAEKYKLKELNNDELINIMLEEFDLKYWFAKISVYNLELYLNLEYSPLYYDYPLSFYTKIDLTNLQEIIDNPWKIYNLSLDQETFFWITSDGGAADCIDRKDIIIPVMFDRNWGWNFLTIVDNYKDKNHYSRTGAYLDDFFWDKLCWLTWDACGELKLLK